MTSRDFCYWLQGHFELTNRAEVEKLEQWQITTIKNHLQMVFKHEIDPSMGSVQHQQSLSDLHAGLSRAAIASTTVATNC